MLLLVYLLSCECFRPPAGTNTGTVDPLSLRFLRCSLSFYPVPALLPSLWAPSLTIGIIVSASRHILLPRPLPSPIHPLHWCLLVGFHANAIVPLCWLKDFLKFMAFRPFEGFTDLCKPVDIHYCSRQCHSPAVYTRPHPHACAHTHVASKLQPSWIVFVLQPVPLNPASLSSAPTTTSGYLISSAELPARLLALLWKSHHSNLIRCPLPKGPMKTGPLSFTSTIILRNQNAGMSVCLCTSFISQRVFKTD